MDPRSAIEHFHVLFARLLCSGPDRADFAIHGGCNLRFFFGSARYSEDLDLDLRRVPVRTLKGRIDKLLAGPALGMPLKARGIRIVDVSSPMQTETTQRWKLALELEGHALRRNTKVEFSRRDALDDAKIEPIDAGFAAHHQLQPLLLPHYPLDAAIRQKVRALVGRAEIQARDVFDLPVLFARAGGDLSSLSTIRDVLPAAVARALDLSFEEYSAQVVAYLMPAEAAAFGSRDAWQALQAQVVASLERASVST